MQLSHTEISASTVVLSGLDGYIGKVNRQLCPLYYAMPKNSGGRSVLSLCG